VGLETWLSYEKKELAIVVGMDANDANIMLGRDFRGYPGALLEGQGDHDVARLAV